MNNNDRVYEVLSAEYNSFIEHLKTLPPEKIIEHSYEKVFKEEIVLLVECDSIEFSPKQAKALLAEKQPLDHLYTEWMHDDSSYCDMLRDCVCETLKDLEKDLIKKERNQAR